MPNACGFMRNLHRRDPENRLWCPPQEIPGGLKIMLDIRWLKDLAAVAETKNRRVPPSCGMSANPG